MIDRFAALHPDRNMQSFPSHGGGLEACKVLHWSNTWPPTIARLSMSRMLEYPLTEHGVQAAAATRLGFAREAALHA